MYFDSFSEFINMAGHGKYVWSCVVISSFLIGLLFFNAAKNYKRQYKLNSKLNNLP